MAEETEVIREQIEETRSKLEENLASLEGQIRETVVSAKSSVDETIESVKQGFRQLNPVHQARERPLATIGVTLAAGVAVGAWVGSRRSFDAGRPTARIAGERAQGGPSRLSSLLHEFDDEFRLVKSMAMGAVVQGLGQVARQALPNYSRQIDEVMGRVAQKVENFADRPQEQRRPTIVS